ncbi:hypothetical protein [Conchiformibius steedae]|uniref:hypothetical protein n=1 Tax=Conchiformibius steedae TaxID=153493 RepID=UPI0015F35EA7|nr:hypothetical protein [Conchiformibius steedae]QMT32567.1 hypothetical protein H3L98_00055 [Conchiformibius steedae]
MANSEKVPQQAHHIIPEAVFDRMIGDFIAVFGRDSGAVFKQLGGNFIYLHNDNQAAERAQRLLSNNKDLFGDLSFGGAWHHGSHPSYDNVVRTRLERIFEGTFSPNPDKNNEIKQMMILDLQRGLKEILIDGVPNVMQANQFDAEAMQNALDGKGIYSPNNPDDTIARRLLNDFNADLHKPDTERFLTRKFGDTGTTKIAEFTGTKLVERVGKLNKVTQFISDTGQPKFKEIFEKTLKEGLKKGELIDATKARQLIYHTTYDVERFLTAADVFKDANGQSTFNSESLNSFLDKFKEAVNHSLTDGKDPSKILEI